MLIRLLELYSRQGYRHSLLEVQKLAYFLQEAGEPLRLRFQVHHFGPYADNLNHALQRIEGHFIRGYGDRSARAEIRLLPNAKEVAGFLAMNWTWEGASAWRPKAMEDDDGLDDDTDDERALWKGEVLEVDEDRVTCTSPPAMLVSAPARDSSWSSRSSSWHSSTPCTTTSRMRPCVMISPTPWRLPEHPRRNRCRMITPIVSGPMGLLRVKE